MTHTSGEGDVKVEAEAGVMWTQAKNTPSATRSWKRQGVDFNLEYPEGMWQYQHLHFSLVKLIKDFWPLEL